MPLEGTLATLPFADLLQILGSTRKTGRLTFRNGRDWKRLYLLDGLVLALGSSDPEEFLGYRLVALGKIAHDDLLDALGREQTVSKALGRLLVDEGKLPAEVLRRHLAAGAFDMVGKLLGWNDARFVFEEFAQPERELVPLDLSIEELLLEGFRRADEVTRLRLEMPSEDLMVERTGADPNPELMSQTLVGVVYRKLDAPRSLRDLRRETKASEFEILQGLSQLIESGALRHKPRPAPPPPPVNWLADASKLMRAGFHTRAVELLRLGLSQEPAHGEARELLDRAEEGLVQEITQAEIPLEATIHLERPLEQIEDQELRPVEFFLLSRVAVAVDVAALLEATPLPAAETLLVIRRLVKQGHIKLQTAARPVPPRAIPPRRIPPKG